MQGNDVEDLEADAPFERQALDNIEAVEFRPSGRHLREVPPLRRRSAADSSPGIKRSSALEDATDRPHRRHQSLAACHELAVEGPGSILAQIARLLQLAAQDEHEVLHHRIGSLDLPRNRRTIAPIDALHGSLPGTSAPPLHGGEAHLMRSCHRAHRRAGPDLCDHRAPLLLPPPPCFLPIASSSQGFPPSISDREVLAPQ